MKKILLTTLIALCCTFHAAMLQAEGLKERLAALPSVKMVEQIESGQFESKYLLWFEQPVDHKDPAAGKFLQRVYVGNVSPDSSSVFVCEGYGGAYGAGSGYRDELSRLFNLNNVVVEHRFFLESVPENADWKYLTAENEANDLHRIITELKTVYPHKWISTGISKGGQNTAIFRAFFPDDVDFSVPYVGPFCRGVEDGRHQPFIADFAGSAKDRRKILEFQTEFLKRREALMPAFDSLCTARNYIYRISRDEAYDYTALEFPFALWQWGTSTDLIPDSDASDKEIFDFMMRISSPDYWEAESVNTPFFVMAAKELGYYGYDTKPLRKWLHIKSAKGYLKKIFLPDEVRRVKFDKTLSKKMDNFIKTTDCRMLFIYGEFDPWSSVRAGDAHGENIRIFIDPAGSHRARVNTFPEALHSEIISILSGWLYE